jgi:hypothetical protein
MSVVHVGFTCRKAKHYNAELQHVVMASLIAATELVGGVWLWQLEW